MVRHTDSILGGITKLSNLRAFFVNRCFLNIRYGGAALRWNASPVQFHLGPQSLQISEGFILRFVFKKYNSIIINLILTYQ
ncbi:hypothetical protein EGI24_06915 [Lacihabitans sp. CS3-21]|nr:hypothetical protein [Lacihabitans sp. CS3-21]